MAIQRAFAVLSRADASRPGKLIYLLTDGNFVDNQEVLNTLTKLNADKKVHVNIILYNNKVSDAIEAQLRAIAENNGGIYKFVSEYD